MFLLFVHVTHLFYRQVCFISEGLLGVLYKICSCHNIAEILLKLALNTNQSIIQKGKAILICMKKNCDIKIQLFTNECPPPLVYWVQALGDPYFTSILNNGTN